MHVEKVKLAGGNFKRLVGHMKREHQHYKSDVDLDRSHLNISLKNYVDDLEGFIRGQGVTRIRKDSVGAYNAVCTVAQEDKGSLVTERDYKSWGWAVIDATLKTFNLTRDDLVGAEIHLDEGSKVEGGNAHIHFSFVPLLRQGDKVTLSAKRVGNKKAFEALHDVLQADMTARGYKGAYVKSEEVRGLSKDKLAEYKKAQEILPKLEKELSNYKRTNQILWSENKRLVEENKLVYAQTRELERLKEEVSKLSFLEKIALRKVKRYEAQLAEKDSFIDNLHAKITEMVKGSRKSPSIQLQEQFKQVQADLDLAKRRIDYLEKENQAFSRDNREMAEQLGLSETDRSNKKQGLERILDEVMNDRI